MANEEKELLLKDLCARLPYGVICRYEVVMPLVGEVLNYGPLQEIRRKGEYFIVNGADCLYEDVKPYLRSMSSMTEAECKEFSIFIGKTEKYIQQICLDADSMANPIIGGNKCVYWGLFDRYIDWLNAHHFDYRGLISMGLALEAPKGIYDNKK